MKFAFHLRLVVFLVSSCLLGLSSGCQRAGYFVFRPAPTYPGPARPAHSTRARADSLAPAMQAGSEMASPMPVAGTAAQRRVPAAVTPRVPTALRRHLSVGEVALVKRAASVLPVAPDNTARYQRRATGPASGAVQRSAERAQSGGTRYGFWQKLWDLMKGIVVVVLPFALLILGIVLGPLWLKILAGIILAGIVAFIWLFISSYGRGGH